MKTLFDRWFNYTLGTYLATLDWFDSVTPPFNK